MKQYRIVSANFVSPNETGDPDAHMDAADLRELKKLAGIDSLGLLEDYTAGGHENSPQAQQDSAADKDMPSPMGSNISVTGMEKRKLEKQNHIKVGTPEWFQLWFSKPYLTGEKPVGDAPAKKIPVNKDKDRD
jgi:hypothetical protein